MLILRDHIMPDVRASTAFILPTTWSVKNELPPDTTACTKIHDLRMPNKQQNDTIQLLTFVDIAGDRTWILLTLFKLRLLAAFTEILRWLTSLHHIHLLSISPVGYTGSHRGLGTPTHVNAILSLLWNLWLLPSTSELSGWLGTWNVGPVLETEDTHQCPPGPGMASSRINLLPRRQETQRAEVVSVHPDLIKQTRCTANILRKRRKDYCDPNHGERISSSAVG
ncbi:hypothetical protein EDB19DRAFT_1908017 [Suillus lakei]|nr:hypothetical protein EDB19DRAFT_1908017 [Suillus lakei]